MRRFNSVRTFLFAGALLLQLTSLVFQSRGAAGGVDLSFDPGSGVNGTVHTVAIQPDGKWIIGGQFTTVKGLARVNLARLNADGSGDATFNPGNNATSGLQSFALQSDGKVLITVSGNPSFQAARLNADGSLDSSFLLQYANSPQGSALTAVVEQPDGKVLFGGFFSVEYFDEDTQSFWYYEQFRIYRAHANGSADNSFFYDNSARTYGIGVLELRCLVLQPDGKVLIGGFGSLVSGTDHHGVARLNADGSADSTFNPGNGANEGGVSSIALQPDGKVLIGGSFSAVNGTVRERIARLNADGSVDTGFDPGSGADHIVFSVAVQPDGKVLMGGFFNTVDGTSRNKIARLNVNGSLDGSFDPGSGANRIVHSVIGLPDGKVLLGGNFTTINGTNRERLARLNADGTLDGTFHPGASINGVVTSLVLQPDGKALIGGNFTSVNGTSRNRIARLNANGSLDASFESGAQIDDSLDPAIESVVVQPDGKVLIAIENRLTAFGTNPPIAFARLNANGTMDSGFNPAAGPSVYAIALQPDGKVLAGKGQAYGASDAIVRVNANGSLDSTFNAQITPVPGSVDFGVDALLVQPDGKVLAGGFSIFDVGEDLYRPLIIRLHANGSPDTSFERFAGEEFDQTYLAAMALQPDGKILMGGDFTVVKETSRNGIARLHANGTLDGTFNPGSGANGLVDSVVVQLDGKILIGGTFTTVNGTNRNRIARLNADGSLDDSFNPGTGANGTVRSMALQSDGNVLIGGAFTSVNGMVRPSVARLHGDSPAPSLTITRSGSFMTISWPVTARNFQLLESTNLTLSNVWSSVAQPTMTNGAQISVTVSGSMGPKFFRLHSQ